MQKLEKLMDPLAEAELTENWKKFFIRVHIFHSDQSSVPAKDAGFQWLLIKIALKFERKRRYSSKQISFQDENLH